jgi:hypothetical protein
MLRRYWDRTEVGPDVSGSAHQRYDSMVRDLSLLMMAPGRKAGDASIHSGQTLHSVSLLVDDNDRR